jgi:hypothetical protein
VLKQVIHIITIVLLRLVYSKYKDVYYVVVIKVVHGFMNPNACPVTSLMAILLPFDQLMA